MCRQRREFLRLAARAKTVVLSLVSRGNELARPIRVAPWQSWLAGHCMSGARAALKRPHRSSCGRADILGCLELFLEFDRLLNLPESQ
jgi:hypothetical protein